MKLYGKWFLSILFLLTAGNTPGYMDYSRDQIRKEVDNHLVDLRVAKIGLDRALADQVAAQAELTGLKTRVHTFVEVKAIQARLTKDQGNIQTCIMRILGDVNFLQTQWSLLTQEEKDFVMEAEKSLS